MRIFGVSVDNRERKDIDHKIDAFLDEQKFHHITTLNPEILLQAKNDASFARTLNSADLALADGIGLHLAAWHSGTILKHRYTGTDLMQDLLERANANHLSVFLVAHREGLSGWEETAAAIKELHPHLSVHGIDVDKKIPQQDKERIKMLLRKGSYDFLFCNFGAPWQEIFLSELKNDKVDTVKIGVGIGGGFDYVTKILPRAPRWMRAVGCEWFFRLLQEPRYRCTRIYHAIIVFPLSLLFQSNAKEDYNTKA